jgi:hypothetical protein
MAKTAAERQKEYRASRQTAGENGERQLNTWVSTQAYWALNRLAVRYGVTKREMLERLLITEQDKTLATIEFESENYEKYMAGVKSPKKEVTE